MIKNIIYNKFAVLITFILVFVVAHWVLKDTLLPTTDTQGIWFYSGLGAMLFSLLFIEPYFTSPKNVLTNSLPLLLVFLAIKENYINNLIWWCIFGFIATISIFSIIAMLLSECGKNKSEQSKINIISNYTKSVVVFLGQGKMLYSIIFVSTLILYYGGDRQNDTYLLTMFVLWFFVVAVNPKNLNTAFKYQSKGKNIDEIGEIFAIQSNKIYLTKIFDDKSGVEKFTPIHFINNKSKYFQGFIFDIYELNNQQWAKICILQSLPQDSSLNLKPNVICKYEKDNLESNIDSFVGIVVENSNISKINFEYSKKKRDLEEGDLLKVEVGGKTIFYQVTNGITNSEILESKNKSGFIKGEAIQLGEWNPQTLNFDKFGWVADMYSPIFKVSSIKNLNEFSYPEYKLGIIPKTNIPSVINLHDAISHHIALIGVTGSGKSFLAREIIKELMQDTKIICVDFTGEYAQKFQNLQTYKFINNKNEMNNFMQSNENIGMFELPSISNTKDVLAQTQTFIESVFEYAKNQQTQQQICLVLEEAHTIVPETSFLGDLGEYGSSKALVNKMGQVALQGRKYGVGLMIIGQRTANISKTILTQCNTMICFQAFDDTNFNFLGNYIGKDLASTLPTLKKYHAVVSGKAIKSNLPLIVDVTREQS